MLIQPEGPGFFILASFICFAIWAYFDLLTNDKKKFGEYFFALGLLFVGVGAFCGWLNPGIAVFSVVKVVFIIFVLAAIIYQVLSKD